LIIKNATNKLDIAFGYENFMALSSSFLHLGSEIIILSFCARCSDTYQTSIVSMPAIYYFVS
jgi:hypothetical protein